MTSLRVPFQVIAPALIPVAPGDRVKTDKRDARRLVRQFRAGELIAIRVPSRREEAVRDLCRGPVVKNAEPAGGAEDERFLTLGWRLPRHRQ